MFDIPKRADGQTDHEYVEALRAMGPVGRDRHGFVWVFSHEHMLACMDPTTTRQVETEKVALMGLSEGPIYEYFANSLLFSNGEVHQRRRGPLARTFAFRMMEALRPRVRAVVLDLIEPGLNREVDFLEAISGPLPARMIAEVIGVPAADVTHVSGLVYPAMRALGLRGDIAALEPSLGALDEYVEEMAARPPAEGSFLAGFLPRCAENDLTLAEVRVQLTSVILAGSDTTRMALASTLSQLAQRPDDWAALRRDPEGMKSKVAAEGLRFDPVIGSLPRVATDEMTLGGAVITPGTVLNPIVPAILRDPDVYDRPADFDINRTDHPRYHPVFGAGAHRCLGEALARAELEEALSALAEKVNDLELIGPPPTLKGLSGARSIDAMHVRLA
ncbi:MAG: cytochrome P450 [Pseudomonadota bacterium]